jgi:hypothetical protein
MWRGLVLDVSLIIHDERGQWELGRAMGVRGTDRQTHNFISNRDTRAAGHHQKPLPPLFRD